MEIKNNLLVNVDYVPSPNIGKKMPPNFPDTIIIHYTAGASGESSVRSLCNPSSKASAHLVIDRSGKITQLVPFNVVAWHAGKSAYGGRSSFNNFSIGIEIDNAGLLTLKGGKYKSWFGKEYPESEVVKAIHRNGTKEQYWHKYTDKQIEVVRNLCSFLKDAYCISQILGHEEISVGRKVDPGPAFPLDWLRGSL
jgi:N-acetylmuramoyl-L-alanine amidase